MTPEQRERKAEFNQAFNAVMQRSDPAGIRAGELFTRTCRLAKSQLSVKFILDYLKINPNKIIIRSKGYHPVIKLCEGTSNDRQTNKAELDERR